MQAKVLYDYIRDQRRSIGSDPELQRQTLTGSAYEGILMIPNEGDHLPLVAFIHGGPHSISVVA